MTDIHLVPPVVIGHMGGETSLNRGGSFELGGNDLVSSVRLDEVLGVEHHDLPAGIVALLGWGKSAV
jgi:hypothetical protein